MSATPTVNPRQGLIRLAIGGGILLGLFLIGIIFSSATAPHATVQSTPTMLTEPTYALPPQLQGYRVLVTLLNDGNVADLGGSTVHVGGAPHGLAVAPDGRVWVTNAGGTNTWIMRFADNGRPQVLAKADAGLGPVHVAFSPDGKLAYATDFAGKALSIIDTHTEAVVDSITTPDGPHAIAIAPDGHEVYIACPKANAFVIVDPAARTITATVALPGLVEPYGVVLAADGKTVYVSDALSGRVLAVDVATRQVKGSASVGAKPALLALIPHSNRLIVANNGSGTASIVDTASMQVVATIPTGAGPHGVAATPDGRFALVANTGANLVSVIDLATLAVVSQIPVGRFPNDVLVLAKA